jgi:hypothetical protein
MATKPDMTWADYLAVAVAPVFIMTLVGSLCFFLLDVGYAGEFSGWLRWILFWFVFGSVMLARVSITQGVAHAGILGAALGAATAVAIAAFVNQALVGCLLVAVVWWCAHKLTWNCTFIDSTVDPSAAGLLQTTGKDDRLADRRIGTRSPSEKVYDPLSDDTFRAEEAVRLQQASRWKRLWRAITDLEPKAHAPGLSVLYFSLAALPLFGLGQWLIPAADEGRQASAFRWLALYLASGLCLLLITSFLGLRRYLRRRNLEMPAAMTTSWIGVGGVMIVVLLLGAMLLPLPGARNDWALAVRDRLLDSPEREASSTAPVKVDGVDSQDANAAQTPNSEAQDESKGQPGESGTQSGEQGDKSSSDKNQSGQANESESASPKGESQSGKSEGNSESSSSNGEPSQSSNSEPQQKSEESKAPGGGNSPQGTSQTGQQSSQQQPGEQGNTPASSPPSHPSSPRPNVMQTISSWFNTRVAWGIALVVGIVLAIVFRRQVIAFLREIAEIWRGLWQMFFPSRAKPAKEAAPVVEPYRPFASFSNPFADGRAARSSADELVKYTFSALEAWAYERGAARRAEETPLEFTARVSTAFPALGGDAGRVGGWLARSLYARQAPPKEAVATLRTLWNAMQSAAVRPADLLVAGR